MSDILLDLATNLEFVDDLYARFRANPDAVDPSWRALFAERLLASAPPPTLEPDWSMWIRAAEVTALVRSYRVRGHLDANLDPLGAIKRNPHPDLDPKSYGF